MLDVTLLDRFKFYQVRNVNTLFKTSKTVINYSTLLNLISNYLSNKKDDVLLKVVCLDLFVNF